MKVLIILVLTFFTHALCGQNHLLNKKGDSYFYNGQEYNWKKLGFVYFINEEANSIYRSGKSNFIAAKYYAVGGAMTVALGASAIAFWPDTNAALYGGIIVATGVLMELGAWIYLQKGRYKMSEARNKFNFDIMEKQGYKSGVSLAIGGTSSGIGLILQF